MLPKTGVTFSCDDAALQKLFDEAERKCLHNLKDFGADTVLVEGGGYEKIWLETQPMGGEMYWKRNMTAAMNNQLLFMRTQRADGRIAGSIQCHPDGTIEPQFNKFQGFCFPLHALNMWYLSGKEPAYLDMLADCLEKFDAYLWKTRDSDGDGCLESFCVYDTGGGQRPALRSRACLLHDRYAARRCGRCADGVDGRDVVLLRLPRYIGGNQPPARRRAGKRMARKGGRGRGELESTLVG